MNANSWSQLRGQGRVRIRKQLWYKGPIRRSEIAKALSLSVPAVTMTINAMIDSGEVRERKLSGQDGRMGRRASAVEIVPEARYYLGVEIRRDSRHVCLVDYQGNVVSAAGEMTSYPDYQPNLAAVCRMVKAFLEGVTVPREKIRHLCVTVPGVVDYTRGVLVSHRMYRWFDRPIARDIAAGLDWSGPILVENDGCTRAQAARMLRRRDFEDIRTFAYLLIARGISCPFLPAGDADVGHPMGIGELGFMMIRADAAITAGHIAGNLSDLAGERALMDRCHAVMRAGVAPRLLAICGGDVRPTIPQILQAQLEGEPVVQEILEQAFRFLAVGLANVYNFVQPDQIFVESQLFSDEANRRVLTDALSHYLMVPHTSRPLLEFVEPEANHGARCAALCAIRADLENGEEG